MAKREGAVPIDPGMIARAIGAIKGGIKGWTDGWFGPNAPLEPLTPPDRVADVQGRQFDYRTGFNRNITPRGEEAISFAMMRGLADNCDVLRIILEHRKDQIAKLPWQITAKDETKQKKDDPRCEELEDFFNNPDKEHDWDTWSRMLLEDLFVIDAPAVYVRKTVGGQLYSIEPVDGATIKRVLDIHGRTPMAPQPAYQQVLKGIPAVNYTTEELIYRPRNVRTHKVYGFSPVEQIIMTVNTAIRRAVHKLQYYTEGNIPEALIGVPETWSPEQISIFQENWDSTLEGNTAQRRHARFVPGGLKPTFTKEDVMKDEFDEWLARIVCFTFGIDPTPFIKQVNRATAETSKEKAISEGLVPIMDWIASLCNHIIRFHFGYNDLKFDWVHEESVDPKTKAEINKIYLDAGVMLEDEVRADIGKEPFTAEQLAKKAEEKAAAFQQAQAAFGGGGKPGDPPNPNDPNAKAKPGDPAAKEPPPKQDNPVEKTIILKMGDTYVDVGGTIIRAEFPDGTSEETRIARAKAIKTE